MHVSKYLLSKIKYNVKDIYLVMSVHIVLKCFLPKQKKQHEKRLLAMLVYILLKISYQNKNNKLMAAHPRHRIRHG